MGYIVFFVTVTEYNKSFLAFFPGMGSGTSHKSGMQGFGYSPVKQGTGESEKPAHTQHTHSTKIQIKAVFYIHFYRF